MILPYTSMYIHTYIKTWSFFLNKTLIFLLMKYLKKIKNKNEMYSTINSLIINIGPKVQTKRKNEIVQVNYDEQNMCKMENNI